MKVNLCPAVRFKLIDSKGCFNILTGEKHLEIYRYMHRLGMKVSEVEEGFLLNGMTFVSRAAATKICVKFGILPSWWDKPLTSEVYKEFKED